mgnify:CR=1 FL=1|jgi:hypothetical protein
MAKKSKPKVQPKKKRMAKRKPARRALKSASILRKTKKKGTRVKNQVNKKKLANPTRATQGGILKKTKPSGASRSTQGSPMKGKISAKKAMPKRGEVKKKVTTNQSFRRSPPKPSASKSKFISRKPKGNIKKKPTKPSKGRRKR